MHEEVEGWHTFLETLSSWLALQEEAFLREFQLYVSVKTKIVQTKLPSDTQQEVRSCFTTLPSQSGREDWNFYGLVPKDKA